MEITTKFYSHSNSEKGVVSGGCRPITGEIYINPFAVWMGSRNEDEFIENFVRVCNHEVMHSEIGKELGAIGISKLAPFVQTRQEWAVKKLNSEPLDEWSLYHYTMSDFESFYSIISFRFRTKLFFWRLVAISILVSYFTYFTIKAMSG